MKQKITRSQIDTMINEALSELSYGAMKRAHVKARDNNYAQSEDEDGEVNRFDYIPKYRMASPFDFSKAIEYLQNLSKNVNGADVKADAYIKQLEEIQAYIDRKQEQKENLDNGEYDKSQELRGAVEKKLANLSDEERDDVLYKLTDEELIQKYGFTEDEADFIISSY